MRYWKALRDGLIVVAVMPGSCVLFTLPKSPLAYTEVPEVNYRAGSFWNQQLPANLADPAYTRIDLVLPHRASLFLQASSGPRNCSARGRSTTRWSLPIPVEM